MEVIVLQDLPKHSLNEIYAGIHYRTRKKHKDTFKLIVKNQFKHVFSRDKRYRVSYVFEWCKRPLDASNCVYMLKMIEDIIFEDDNYKIIPELNIKSVKAKTDQIIIKIQQL